MSCDVEAGCAGVPADSGPPPPGDGGGIDGGPPVVDTGPPPIVDGGCTGECTPGAMENSAQGCGRCGSEPTQRTCGADCRWGGWAVVGGCGGEGPCSPGATNSRGEVCGPCGVMRTCTQTCNGSCNWDPESCGGCPGSPMCTDYFGATHCPGVRGCANCGAEVCVTCTCGGGGGWETCDGPICG
jgi:hypothetical protein